VLVAEVQPRCVVVEWAEEATLNNDRSILVCLEEWNLMPYVQETLLQG